MVETQIYYPKHTSIWKNVASITGIIIIVQINIHHRSNARSLQLVYARLNPERNVIKCVGGR